jgi:Na+/phosphate symporter
MFGDLTRSDFMPHGYCFLWQPDILWMHVVSDAVIITAYYSIPFTLLYLLRKKKTTSYRWVLAMFSAFIFLCGTSHLVSAISIWKPLYYLEGLVKVLTACASIATAVMLFPFVPRFLDAFNKLDEKESKQQSDSHGEISALTSVVS